MNTTKPRPASEFPRVVSALAAAAAVHGFAPLPAAGQETASPAPVDDEVVPLPELEVTGTTAPRFASPKFTAPILDLPQSLSTIPREVFVQQGAQNLSDVLRNAPGITFLAGEGGNASSADGDAFFMRGFDASYSIFVDGVRDTGQYHRDVFNVEQVEVAKGPAGTDIGRGATSGYVNLSTKTPRLGAVRAASVAHGSGGKQRATVDLNHTLDPTRGVALRLNALWQEGGVAGRELAEENRRALAPSLALGLGRPTRLFLAGERYEQDDRPDYGLSRAALPDGGGFQPRPPPVDQDTFFGTVDDFDEVTSSKYTARLEHDLASAATLSNQTRVTRTDRKAHLTAPIGYTPASGLVTRSRQGNERSNEMLSNLTNLSAAFHTAGLRHALSAGLEYAWETQLITSHASAPLGGTPLDRPDHASPGVAPVPSGASSRGSMETIALYAFDTVHLGAQWQLSGGLRRDDYDARYRSTDTSGAVTRTGLDGRLTSWKAGLVHKPVAAGSLYLACGNSFRPPGTNLTLSTNSTNADHPGLAPQEARNLELGAKWAFFQGALSASAALFQSENRRVASTDSEGQVVQQNDQEVRGIELGASGRVTENWMLQAGLALLDTSYSAPSTVSNAALDGARLQWTPGVSASLWSTWRLPSGLTLGGGLQYQGETRRQTTNTPAAALPEVPDYWVADLVAAYPVNKHMTLRLNVNNVFDRFHLRSLNNNGNRYHPGAPRSFLLSAEVSF